jgi:hypothetical protein
MHEHRGPGADSSRLIAHMMVDLLLVGGSSGSHDKLEIHRAANGKRCYPEDEYIVAVASDIALPDCPLPQLPLDNVAAIAAFIVNHCGLVRPRQRTEPAT